MRGRILHIIAQIANDYRKISRMMAVPSKGQPKTTRTSPKSKLKLTKSKPNIKYKSSKPVASKGITTHRNKSNLR